MPKLINKPQTNLSNPTTNKTTLQFGNTAIEKYLPTFGNLRHKSILFRVPLKSHLKGLTLRASNATKKKYFVLWHYWFQSKYHLYTLGSYGPGFGVKEVSNKLFDIVEEHTNDKGLWIKDEIKLTPVETTNEVLKIALTKELKLTEWVEPETITDSKKEDKTQASIQ